MGIGYEPRKRAASKRNWSARGLYGPSRKARKVGVEPSAADNAEPGGVVSVVGNGRRRDADRRRLGRGKRSRQRQPAALVRHRRPAGRPVACHPHAVERLFVRRRRAGCRAMVGTADRLGSVSARMTGLRLRTLGLLGPRRRLGERARCELRAQGGSGDQGDEQAQRRHDGDDRPPSSRHPSALTAHSGRTVQGITCQLAINEL